MAAVRVAMGVGANSARWTGGRAVLLPFDLSDSSSFCRVSVRDVVRDGISGSLVLRARYFCSFMRNRRRGMQPSRDPRIALAGTQRTR
jgi:hypothetical protein